MVWTAEVYRVYFNGEVVFESTEPLTATNVKVAAVKAGIYGKFDVFDRETGKELFPRDFPYSGDVVIKPRYTAA